MAIIVKNKNIKETIEDENGNVLGEIQYNPEDTTTYSKLCNILDDILKINSKLKEVSGIKNFSEKLNSIDEFEQHSEDFNKIKEAFNFYDEQVDKIIKEIDNIFGKGTCEIMMANSKDIDLLTPLIEGVLPKFKEQRTKKAQKYLNDSSVEQLDVME